MEEVFIPSSSNVGKALFTKRAVPGLLISKEEPNGVVESISFDARYIQERSALLKGSSSRSSEKKYCLYIC